MKTRKNIFGIVGCFLALMIGSSIGITSFGRVKGYADDMIVDGHFSGYSDDMDENLLHNKTRLPYQSSDAPSITILVHGQGGDASHFSNNLDKDETLLDSDEKGEFVYEQNSIVDLLSKQLNYSINLYYAKFDIETEQENDFFLYDLNPNQLNPNEVDNFSYIVDDKITEIENVARHTIIYFESSKPYGLHREVYEELHTLIDKISYDYLVLTGRIPKVNLISHSRGGLTSMMYATGYRDKSKTAMVEYTYNSTGNLEETANLSYTANGGTLINDHPFNVGELYSMGTPYWGTDWDTKFFGVAHELLPTAFDSASAENILDSTIQQEIHQCWEDAVKVNPQLKLHAIAGETSLRFILGLMAEDINLIVRYFNRDQICDYLNSYFDGITDSLNDFVDTIQSNIQNQNDNENVVFELFNQIVSLVVDNVVRASVENISNKIEEIQVELTTTIQNLGNDELEQGVLGFVNTVGGSFSSIIECVEDIVERLEFLEESDEIVLSDDKSYSFISSWGDLFIDRDSQFAVGFSNVTRVRKIFHYDQVIIRSENGKYVVNKDEQSKNFDYKRSVKNVGIPHNLETHDANIIAYVLENITMGTQKTIFKFSENGDGTSTVIGYEIPEYFNWYKWENIDLNLRLTEEVCGKNVSEIDDFAFEGFSHIGSIEIPASVIYIGDRVFRGCNYLNITVDENNPYYCAENNILYNKTKTSIIATGDIPETVVIPETVEYIYDYAFSNNSNLVFVHIYGTPNIGNYAFSDCMDLDEVYFYSYEVPALGTGAFLNDWFILYVPYSRQSAYGNAFTIYRESISFIPITVTFIADSETYNTLNTYFGAEIIDLPILMKEGYIFNYWVDGNGVTYKNGGYWNSTEDLTVYADWTARQSYINFSGYGTDGLEDKLVTYDERIGELPIPILEGYTFLGWKDLQGEYYSADTIWKQTSNLVLIADYDGIDETQTALYFVALDQDGGEGGSDNVTVAYSSKMPTATAPTRTGYDFQGYYTDKNGVGEKYYNADMSSAKNWEIPSDTTLYAYWEGKEYTVTLKLENSPSAEEIATVTVTYGALIPTGALAKPIKEGYTFLGFYDNELKQYIQADMTGNLWDKLYDTTLYANWNKNYYEITLHLDFTEYADTILVGFDDEVIADNSAKYIFNREGYDFHGFYSERNGKGTKYFGYKIAEADFSEYLYELVGTGVKWSQPNDGTLYAYWTIIDDIYMYEVVISNAQEEYRYYPIRLKHGNDVTIIAPTIDGYTFEKMYLNGYYYETASYTLNNVQLKRNLGYGIDGYADSKPFYLWYPQTESNGTISNNGGLFMIYQKNEECVAAGTLITLADGRQVPVETLTGNERLLVWNLYTGQFDTAPILFIDSDPAKTYRVIHLYFSDGTQVKVIHEHAFFDFNLNEYVFLREDAGRYIGHWFNKQTTDEFGNMTWTRVQLTNVTITEEYTTAWSPVTYGHLCIYVNGMLSMPGATTGLINIFEVDGETMRIDQAQYLADIERYGLFTYEEFAEIYAIPEEIYEAFNGQYLKVSIGKGLIDYERLGELIESYAEFFESSN